MKKIVLMMVLLTCAAGLWAQSEDVFEAGNMEFGGEFHLTWQPGYYITDPEDKEANSGEYDLYVDATGSIGLFLNDRLSIQFIPGIFYYRNVWDQGEDAENQLSLILGLGADYYFRSSSPLVFSTGLDVGLRLLPGIDGQLNGSTNPNDSFALVFEVSPNVTAYYFVSERLAPFIDISSDFLNYKQIKNSSGDDYEYPAGKGFMDYWIMQLKVSVGLKYFLPTGFRFLEGNEKKLPEFTTTIGS